MVCTIGAMSASSAEQRDLVGDRVLALVRRAQRVAVHVRAHLAEHVVQVADESLEGLVAGVVGTVGGSHVLEHLALDGGVGQRHRLELHRHRGGVVERDREVRAVELVAVGEHRDEVLAVVELQARGQGVLVALRDDRRGVRGGVEGGPVTGLGVVVGRRRARTGRGLEVGAPGGVPVDDERVGVDGSALGHAGASERPRLGAGAGDLEGEDVRRRRLCGRRLQDHEPRDRERHGGQARQGAPPVPFRDLPHRAPARRRRPLTTHVRHPFGSPGTLRPEGHRPPAPRATA